MPLLHSVRAKFLIVLAVLSLPLLIVSLIQLNNYRRDLGEQATAATHTETNAAAGALLSWLESHPSYAKQAGEPTPAEVEALYSQLRRSAASDSGTVIAVFDAQGRLIKNQSATGVAP
ncbi:MAG: hypothetical protein M3362_09050, partial [Acidobacteriota bacterium]|nr:hypothetical protein [Acidobacteriota bacterium]